MNQAISTQHPAVVLRSRYQQLRALLAVAMIAVVGLTAAVVILAIQNDEQHDRSCSESGERAERERDPFGRRPRGERRRRHARTSADGVRRR